MGGIGGAVMHKRLRDSLLATGLVIACPVAAQDGPADQQIVQGPPPVWAVPSEPLSVPADASGLVFVRHQDAIVRLEGAGQSTFVGQRIVLLHPQSLQLGNVGIEWNPAAGTPVVHAVKIHRGGQEIDVLQNARFEVMRREDLLEQAMLTGTLTAVLRVPDLRVGDELEVAYTLPTGDPTLRDQNASFLSLGESPQPGRYRLGISWEDGQEPLIRASADFAAAMSRNGNAIELRADNPPALVPPKDAPPRYAWQRVIEYSDFPSWASLSQRFSALFVDAAKLAPESTLKREAARIAAANPTARERAQAALSLVQQQVRYVYVGLNGGNFRPASAEETWQRRYGDCKGKTALLLALLAELEIPAEAVLARNAGPDDGFDLRLPNPALFDHVLVRATIDGISHWLDGTLPVVATASTTPDFPYRWVLPLTQGGSELEHLAWQPSAKPDTLSLYEIDARSGLDVPARIVTTSIKRGPEALVEYLQLSAYTPDQMLQAFRSNLTGDSSWNSIDSVRYRFDVAQRASVLEIAGTGPLDWDSDGSDGSRSMSLPGGGFSPPGRRQRADDQDQTAPFYDPPGFSCHVTTVRVPVETRLENWRFNSTFDTKLYGRVYYRTFDRRDGSVRMIRGSRTEQVEIDRAQAERDNARLARFDNSMAWLTYDPSQAVPMRTASETVPATYESDWVSVSDACMPADMRS
jgi:transglutaminase-like putative cysteine protease